MAGRAKSYYAATAHTAPERPALEGEETCDICVIGAGYSGLSTALHLAEKGYKVIVLEAVSVGFGASGRNGGQIINGYSRDFDVLISRYGEEMANDLLALSFEGGDIIRERIKKYNIDCDLQQGSFFAALNKKQMLQLEKRKEAWEKAGNKELELCPKERLPEIVDTKLYIGGLLDRRGGHIHALNLALGEAAALESLGGKIFEESPVTHIDEDEKPAAHTKHGKVTADYIVVCGNAYLGDVVPELSDKIMSVSSQVVATEPLGADLAKKMLPQNFCVEDCNYLLDYYRMTADHRLLFGGGVIYSGDTPADITRRLQPHILKTFPYLKGKKIEFAWSGNFALTLTRMPHVGRISDTIYFIQGDSGHGVTTCHLLGRLVAEAINGQATRFDVFATMREFVFPGGRAFRVPLTALGAWYYGLREQLGI
jgi:gamma-glutamylputrescine oxidase